MTKFCSECGAPLDEDTRFCSRCGIPVITDIESSTGTISPPPESVTVSTVTPQEVKNHEVTLEKPKSKTKSKQQTSLKIIPLLYWGLTWGIGWGLISIILNLYHYGGSFISMIDYFTHTIVGFISGLLAGVIIQWIGVSNKLPTRKIFAMIVFGWAIAGAMLSIILEMYIFDFGIYIFHYHLGVLLYYMLLSALLGWMVLRQIVKIEGISYSRSVYTKMLIGWALCGLIAIILERYILMLLYYIT